MTQIQGNHEPVVVKASFMLVAPDWLSLLKVAVERH